MPRLLRPLDRYVFSEFWRIFVTTALGFPVLVFVIDLTDKVDTYLSRQLPKSQIALSYLYWLPDSMFMVLPAAVLFATVFSIGAFTRHSEITAAKASGMSFYRLVAPIFVGAFLAMLCGLAISELAPITNARRLELLEDQKYKRVTDKANFAFASVEGRTYKVGYLSSARGTMDNLEIERPGTGEAYPTVLLAATQANYRDPASGWVLRRGTVHVIGGELDDVAIHFDSSYNRQMIEKPQELLANARSPQEMRWGELGRFIAALDRSGADTNVLKVERALKIAIPVTCLVIVLFGAPLATSTQRGGTAFGVGISLATTVIFLMLIQLTKAIGGKGLIAPELAAWIPNAVFAVIGTYLFARVRT